MDKAFYITANELKLSFNHGKGSRRLSFGKSALTFQEWQVQAKQKLSDLLGLELPVSAGIVRELRTSVIDSVEITALAMQISDAFSIPAYLLVPKHVQYIYESGYCHPWAW